ncbi:MAG: DUF5694 domain-containing protein [Bacteroidota bacterium]
MKYLSIILSIFLLLNLPSIAQTNEKGLLLDPDKILLKGKQPPKVLLVGSFHFAYYGLDAHVTKEEEQVNVLSPKRQAEMKELLDYIATFKPTKIAVEGGRNSGYIIRRFERYMKNPKKLKANEIDQIAFPLMKKFELDTLYGVNSYGLNQDLYNHPDSLTLRPLLDSMYKDWDYRSESEMSKRYFELYDADDRLALDNSLLDYFKHMNTDKSINRGWGAYLVGDFKNGSYEGADAMAVSWYSRNLRIYRNIQNITEEGDRILVIFGAGHLTILKNLFECSPEYELVKFNDL